MGASVDLTAAPGLDDATVVLVGVGDAEVVRSFLDRGAARVVALHEDADALERLAEVVGDRGEVVGASSADEAVVTDLLLAEKPSLVVFRTERRDAGAPGGGAAPGPEADGEDGPAWVVAAAAAAGCERVLWIASADRGDGTTQAPEHSDASLRAALSNERAGTDHLRRVNEQQQALLRRRAVRAALGVDRRVRRVTRELERRRQRVVRRLGRAGLAVTAVPGRRHEPARRRDLDRALAASAGTPVATQGGDEARRTVSVVVVTAEPLASPPPLGEGTDVELVVVRTTGRASAPPGVDHVDLRSDWRAEAQATAAGIAASSGEVVCILGTATRPLVGDWLSRLVAEVRDDVVAATPLVLHPARPLRTATPHDLRTRHRGLRIDADGDMPTPRALDAGSPPRTAGPVEDVDGGTGACMVFDRRAYEDAGGLAPIGDLDAALVELCGRLRTAGGRVVVVPSAVVADHRPVRGREALVHPVDTGGDSWRAVLERQGPALVQLAHGDEVTDHLTFVLSVAAPAQRTAARWGDWHLAQSLARSLRRLGHVVRVQSIAQIDETASRTGDVHLVLRGKTPVRRSSGQRHVLWVISHPESISTEECDEADLVLVASERFAESLRRFTRTPVEVLLQATDHRRFRPLAPVPEHSHAVAVVANTRGQFRPVVGHALHAGLRPAIYGTGWGSYVDPELIVAEHVPNKELPSVYSSVGVLLNDHWDTMRAWGFVSNRLFDALACGTPIVSDHLPELHALVGDTVATYRRPDDLAERVAEALADPVAARRRADEGRRQVLAEHTFDVRARQLVDAITRNDLDRRTP